MSERPLFDPSRARGATSPEERSADATGGAPPPLRVGELSRFIENALAAGLPPTVRVRGEISGFRDRTHWWFDLKDDDAVISCAMFASATSARREVHRAFGGGLRNGLDVVATGRIGHYAKQGKTQLYVERIEPAGAEALGPLERRFRALCEELRAKGYFAPERKRALPVFPRRVAVVTSRSGAALQDVLRTMRSRCAAVDVAVVDVPVQGEGAAERVAAAVRWLSREHRALGVDVVVVTRGGGSMEDLWAFNERVVADAVFGSEVPIVAAIGHETDTTVIELVADERASTPTQAAMRVTPDGEALAQEADHARRRLASAMRRRVEDGGRHARLLGARSALSDPMRIVVERRDRAARLGIDLSAGARRSAREARVRLERASARLARLRPEAVYAARRALASEAAARLGWVMRSRLRAPDLDDAARRLRGAGRRGLAARSDQLGALGRELSAVGPENVLRRGYSVTLGPDGRVVMRDADVRAGDVLETRLAEGRVRSVVEGERSRPARRSADEGAGLFGGEPRNGPER